jgi:lipoprotein NlpD
MLMWGLAAYAPSTKRPAPVEDRGASTPRSPPSPTAMPSQPSPQVEGATYTVQRGDTLAKIALDHGVSWRDLARWNQIDNPHLIEVGQVLRVSAPGDAANPRTVTARPLPPQGARAASVPVTPMPSPTSAGSAASAAPASAGSGTGAPAALDDAPAFLWPAQGQVLGGFDEARNKGLDIGGKAGDAVLAAADGRVVYAGSGLRGYGNLIIVKHNNTYLTAYAHNQSLLVKEDQDVKRGQKIAEMGNTDADQIKLHFEIRRQGKPVDPARLLPPR